MSSNEREILQDLFQWSLQSFELGLVDQFLDRIDPLTLIRKDWPLGVRTLEAVQYFFVTQYQQQKVDYTQIALNLVSMAKTVSQELQNSFSLLINAQSFHLYLLKKLQLITVEDQMIPKNNDLIEADSSMNYQTDILIDPNISLSDVFQENKTSEQGKSQEQQRPFQQYSSISRIKYRQGYIENQTTSNKMHCICQIDNILAKSQKKYQCKRCLFQFHNICMKVQKSNYCPYCNLVIMHPLKSVKYIAYETMLNYQWTLHQNVFFVPKLSEKETLECRSVKMQHTNGVGIFPDIFSISVNNDIIATFNPLKSTSSAKIRPDKPCTIPKDKLYQNQDNKISFSQQIHKFNLKKIRYTPAKYFIGIYVVEQKQIKQFQQQSLKDSVLSYKQAEERLLRFFKTHSNQQLSINKVKISLKCPFTAEKIKLPARGAYCEHLNCFDLSNEIMFNKSAKHTWWKCSICAQSIYEMYIDPIQLEILSNKQYVFEQIQFQPSGMYSLYFQGKKVSTQRKLSDLVCFKQLTPKRNIEAVYEKMDFQEY